ncbi:hypothetical protein GCM10010984_04630 [Chishuiella changwenlii]|uniref:Knr4/Smi1-like domain-containing protein n=2 Tax=Chishuiella changwenlii TaxID=1434701 RepID=A0ABQ1TC52_9FLAO|nr:hypothetical protein GCM10010984_04630 [Chishuiella changwenlii]
MKNLRIFKKLFKNHTKMNILQDLEEEFGFVYPEIYKQLYHHKMLDWGETSLNWIGKTFPKLQENPPFLLYSYDFELINPKDILESIKELKTDAENGEIKLDYKYIPFGKTAGGDLYVFQIDLEINNDIPIVFLPHDEDSAEILAKNLQDFTFRQLLESLTEIDEYSTFYNQDEKQLKANLIAQLKTHESYLKPHWIGILKEIYSKDIFKYSYDLPNGSKEEGEGLLTFNELDSLLEKEIGFNNLNESYQFRP